MILERRPPLVVEVVQQADNAPGLFVLVDFVCRPLGGVLRSASDADDAKWVGLSELTRYDVAPVTISVIQKAAARGFDVGDRPLVW